MVVCLTAFFFFLFSYLLLILEVNIAIDVCTVAFVVLPEVFLQMRVWILVLCIVIVSGCPGPAVNDGVEVSSFGFDFSTISDKEQVQLSCEIENVGAFDAEDVSFFLYGYDDAVWVSVDEDASIGTASDGEWTIDEFRGYDMDTKAQGMSAGYYRTFEIPPDTLSKGITQRYNFNGRLCYYYETRANAKVKAISAAERRDEKSKGKYSGGGVEVWNSYGPIQVQVKTKSPLVFYESGGGREAELVLIIRDVAGGFPSSSGCSLDIDVSDTNKLASLDVSLDGVGLDCDETYSFYDGEAVVYCLYDVGESRPKGEYLLSVVAGYYYYVDVASTVSVVGSSDDVEVGTSTGRDRDGVAYVGGYCDDLCEESAGDSDIRSLAVCSDSEYATYPGTDIEVELALADAGTVSGEVYLSNLKLHDVTVVDIGLTSLAIGKLDKPLVSDISRQFTESSFKVDSDGDGLPDEWEDMFSPTLKKRDSDSDDDGKKDGDEICGTKCGGSGCDSEGTFKSNYRNGCRIDEYYGALSLELEGNMGDAIVTSSENPSEHKIDGDEPVDGMKIVGIGDKTIAEMTDDSSNSKIQAVKYIDVEDLNLDAMINSFDKLFEKTKCRGVSSYDEDVKCMCVQDVEGGQYPSVDIGSASRCDARCENLGYDDGGGCANIGSDYTRCDGKKLVKFEMKISDHDDEKTNYGCDSLDCWCYTVQGTLSDKEAQLLCE